MKIIHLKCNYRIIIVIMMMIILLLATIYWLTLYRNHMIFMNSQNFTTLLKDIHNNVYEYSGDSISLSGYIFKADDFKSNQFVIARNMMISDSEYRIVGFLCESEIASELEPNTWVSAEGIIMLGNYHGPMPIIHVEKLKEIKIPKKATVLPPI